MPYSLTRYERETHYNFNEEEQNASVDTRNVALIHRLRSLASERPDEVHITLDDQDHICAVVPKKWVKLRPSQIYTEEQKQRMYEHAKNLSSFRKKQ